MTKKILLFLLLSVTALSAVSHYEKKDSVSTENMSEQLSEEELCAESDSLPSLYGNLEEVVVERPEVVIVNGLDIYFPSEEIKKNAKSGVKLLFDMQIPSLNVDPINNSIRLIGEGNLLIMINGRPANVYDVSCLDSSMISKIEYSDNPSMQYKDCDAMINIIVRTRDVGGSFYLNALTGLNHGWGNYQLSLKQHLGRSEFGINYQTTPMYDINCWRDNREKFILFDGTTIERQEVGIPVRNDNFEGSGKVYYNYSIPQKILLSLEFKLANISNSNNIAGRILENGIEIFQTDKNPIKSINPAVDLYLQYNFNSRQKLYFNAIYSFSRNFSERHYIENFDEVDIHSQIIGYDKFVSVEGYYEHQFQACMLSVGVRHKTYWNKECGSQNEVDIYRNTENVSTMFGEWKQRFNKFSYSIGLETNYYNNQSSYLPTKLSQFSIQPKLTLQYDINYNSRLKANLKCKNELPPMKSIYPMVQQIDKWQFVVGNSTLLPFSIYSSSLEYELSTGIFSGKLKMKYDYAKNPVMSYKYWENEMLIKSYRNQRGWSELKFELDYRLRLLSGKLTLSGSAGWHRYVSQGENYNHSYSQPFVSAQLTFNHKGWFALAKFNTNINKLWGEEINGGWNLQIVGVGYTYQNAMFMAGITNPFINNFHVTSRDLNEYASYDREYYTNCTNNLIWVGVTINTSWGKHYKGGNKKLENDYSRGRVTVEGK